jgi:hypothetical protein
MATITELNLIPGRRETDMVLNVYATSASGGVEIQSAIPETKYGIKSIVITSPQDDEWFEILNGTSPFIGPVCLGKNIPYSLNFESPIYCDVGNAMILKTQTDFILHLMIQGKISLPVSSVSASVSASPSV